MRPIAKNHSNAVPRFMVFFDTESTEEPIPNQPKAKRHVLRLGVAIAGRWRDGKFTNRKVVRFTRWGEFWRLVKSYLRKRQTVWLFAHNIGFDLTLVKLWELMDQEEFEISAPGRNRQKETSEGEQNRISKGLFVTSSPPTIIGLQHKDGGRIVCCDTLNYWKTSLKEIGDWVGIAKGEFPGTGADTETLFKYCETDVAICEAAIIKLIQWVEKYDLGMFRYTAPGQAWSAFRHRFMKHDIWPREGVEIKTHEREGYFGGQYLLFKMGLIKGPIYQYDVNGLYPSVMQSQRFPCDLQTIHLTDDMSPRRPLRDVWRAVATVEVDTDQLVPHRIRDGSVEYATGNFVTTLSGPELAWLDSLGHIVKWGSYAKYKCEPLFKDYIEFFWELRQKYQEEGDSLSAGMCKLFLNSLSGKPAQKSPRWKHCPEVCLEYLWGRHLYRDKKTGEPIVYRAISGEAFREMPPGEKKDNFPAISGFICSHGRLRMAQLRAIAGPGNIYYQAVDSLAVNEQGRANLLLAGELDETQLGKLKLQCTGTTAYFQAKNWYRVGNQWKRSGINPNLEQKSDGSFDALEFQRLDSILHGKPPPGVTVIEVNKRFNNATVHGTIDPDGWVTAPHYKEGERIRVRSNKRATQSTLGRC